MSMLIDEDARLESELIETFLADYNAGQGGYPKSHSDLTGCVRNLMMMFEIKRRPVAVKLRYKCDLCDGVGQFVQLDDSGTRHCKTCSKCHGRRYVN